MAIFESPNQPCRLVAVCRRRRRRRRLLQATESCSSGPWARQTKSVRAVCPPASPPGTQSKRKRAGARADEAGEDALEAPSPCSLDPTMRRSNESQTSVATVECCDIPDYLVKQMEVDTSVPNRNLTFLRISQ